MKDLRSGFAGHDTGPAARREAGRQTTPGWARGLREGLREGLRGGLLLLVAAIAVIAGVAAARPEASPEAAPEAGRQTPAAAGLRISRFASAGLEGWDRRSFAGRTDYALVASERGTVLEATADGSASGMFREIETDAVATPLLEWSWWIERPVTVDDVRAQEGDDFAARVYVVFDGGWAFWRTTTLVYVWADGDAPDDSWANPFTAQARMFAVRRGGGARWYQERRDLEADYREAFGKAPPPIVAVAVMTDTDQTGTRARARYADIRLLPRAAATAPRSGAAPTRR